MCRGPPLVGAWHVLFEGSGSAVAPERCERHGSGHKIQDQKRSVNPIQQISCDFKKHLNQTGSLAKAPKVENDSRRRLSLLCREELVCIQAHQKHHRLQQSKISLTDESFAIEIRSSSA
jgi:hypothetical protein